MKQQFPDGVRNQIVVSQISVRGSQASDRLESRAASKLSKDGD